MKNYNQSNKVKESFSNPLFDYLTLDINKNKSFDKWELAAMFNTSERNIRKQYEEIANYYPVVATSDKKGYKLVTWDSDMPTDALEETEQELLHQINEIESRIDNLNARLKPLIANRIKIREVIDSKSTAQTNE